MHNLPVAGQDADFAYRLAKLADQITLTRLGAQDLAIQKKPDRSFVTDADRAVELKLRKEILRHQPGDAIYGEEYGPHTGSPTSSPTSSPVTHKPDLTNPANTARPAREWIIDPIDGTASFMRGVPGWATLIALAEHGTVKLGVISAPALKSTWIAAHKQGAWRKTECATEKTSWQRLHVSAVEKLEDASISFQSIAQWRDAGRTKQLLNLTENVWRDRGYGDALAYTLLAEGAIDAVCEHDVKAYDLAAPAILVKEAGGKFTDTNGSETVWGLSALATNALLHELILEKLREEPK